MQSGQEKLTAAEQVFNNAQEVCKMAQTFHWQKTIPEIMQRLFNKEEERSTAVNNAVRNWCLMERHVADYNNKAAELMVDKIESTDIPGDLEELYAEHMVQSVDGGEDVRGVVPAISVRSLLNPIKAGRILKKADENDTAWKPRYFVLMGDRTDPMNPNYQPTSGRLYYFESEDALKPKGVLDLSVALVYSVEESLFGGDKKNLFVISTSLTTTENNNLVTKKKMLYLSAESAAEKEDWITLLRRYALCCLPDLSCSLSDPVSLNLDQTEQVVADFPKATPKETSLRVLKSVRFWIMECRDLHVLDPQANDSSQVAIPLQRGFQSFCSVSVNSVRLAKTTLKSSSNPFWSEEFLFDELTECETEFKVIVHTFSRRREVELGYATIPLVNFRDSIIESSNHVHKKYEQWIPLRHLNLRPSVMGADQIEGNPAVRVAAVMTEETIMPLYEYPSFLNTLFGDNFKVLRALARTASRCLSFARDDFAKSLIAILVATKMDIHAFRALLEVDVRETEDPHVLFRGNSLSTKAIDHYMKYIGGEFLKDVLSAPIKSVYERAARGESCEIDPTRLDRNDDEFVKKQQKKLLTWVNTFWNVIQNSVERCPVNMRETLQNIRIMVIAHFQSKVGNSEKDMATLTNLQYSSVSGFVFLRFFCPAILSPKLFGLAQDIPDNPLATRTLTLIAKILQNLANLTDFKGKEPHMEFCNQWLVWNMDAMRACIMQFATSNPDNPVSQQAKSYADERASTPIDLSREFNLMFLHIANNYSDLKTQYEDAINPKSPSASGQSLSGPADLKVLFENHEVLKGMYSTYLMDREKNRRTFEDCPHIAKQFAMRNLGLTIKDIASNMAERRSRKQLPNNLNISNPLLNKDEPGKKLEMTDEQIKQLYMQQYHVHEGQAINQYVLGEIEATSSDRPVSSNLMKLMEEALAEKMAQLNQHSPSVSSLTTPISATPMTSVPTTPGPLETSQKFSFLRRLSASNASSNASTPQPSSPRVIVHSNTTPIDESLNYEENAPPVPAKHAGRSLTHTLGSKFVKRLFTSHNDAQPRPVAENGEDSEARKRLMKGSTTQHPS